MARVRSTGDVTEFSTGVTGAVIAAVFFGLPTLTTTAAAIVNLQNGVRGAGIFLLVLAAVFLCLGVLLAYRSGRRARVTGGELRIPVGLVKWRRLRLTDLTAVGLVYCSQPRVSGWLAFAWFRNDPVLLPAGLVRTRPPTTGQDAERAALAHYLATSTNGELCRRIEQQTTAARSDGRRNSSSPLPTTPSGRGARAFWSPAAPEMITQFASSVRPARRR